MARQMKESGVSWIGQVPQSWKVVRTKNCYTNKKQVVGDEADNYERLALTLNGVIKRPKDDATGLQPEEFSSYQILRENELVFKLIDLANVATSRVGYSPYVGIVSPAYIILHPKHDDESRFGEYYFLSMWQREIFNHMGDDGVRSSLNATDLLNIPYLLVPNDEKSKIVKFLDATCAEIDAVITKTKATIEEYKKLKQSIITEAVTKGTRGDRPMKDSGVEWIGNIPSEWSMQKMNRICSTITDYVASGSFASLAENVQYLDEPDYAMLIRTIDVSGKGYSSKPVYINKHSYDFLSNSNLFGGEIILPNIGASVGDVYIVPNLYERMSLAPNSIMIRTLINDKYVYYYYCSLSGRLSLLDIAQSTAQPKFNKTDFRQLKIPVPDNEEQEEIVDFLDKKCAEIDTLIAKKTTLLEEMETYKKSVIYEYVTGKKEV